MDVGKGRYLEGMVPDNQFTHPAPGAIQPGASPLEAGAVLLPAKDAPIPAPARRPQYLYRIWEDTLTNAAVTLALDVMPEFWVVLVQVGNADCLPLWLHQNGSGRHLFLVAGQVYQRFIVQGNYRTITLDSTATPTAVVHYIVQAISGISPTEV